MAESIKVWSKFTASKDICKVKFKIVDVPSDRYDELADFMVKFFATEEATFKALGVAQDERAVMEYRVAVKQLLSCGAYHGTVCCVDNDDDSIGEFVGASILMLTTHEEGVETQVQPGSEILKKLIKISLDMDKLYDPKKIHNLDKYYDDRGIVVRPDYRGNGVAQNFLRVRRIISKEHGVPMTGAWMTSHGTQKAAERDGWIVRYKLPKKEIGDKFGLMYDPDAPEFSLFMTNV